MSYIPNERGGRTLQFIRWIYRGTTNGSGVMALYRFFKFQFQLAQIRTFDIPLERSARADLENVYVQGSSFNRDRVMER